MTTPTVPVVRYPSTITPHGEYHIIKGRIPDITLTSFDGTVEFYLMGGRSITDHITPESVRIKDIKGLIAPWQVIDQKGATQDGTTFVTALNDPIEIEIQVEARGRDPQYLRQVVSDLYRCLDSKQTGILSFYTQWQGRWWGKVRWSGPPQESVEKINVPRQYITLNLRVDDGFWRTYDDTDQFPRSHDAAIDVFGTDFSGGQNLGTNWPLFYSGAGAGYISTVVGSVVPKAARWYTSGSTAREVVAGPYKNYNTTSDNQIISILLGNVPGTVYQDGAYNDIWGRMSRDGSGNWTGNGIRARIGLTGTQGWVSLSRYNSLVETVMAETSLVIPPQPNDQFTLICGSNNAREFRVLRNGLQVLIHQEPGTASLLGSSYRGVGFGAKAGAGSTQTAPAWVKKVSVSDNSANATNGFLQRVNIGDQPMFDDYVIFGPGTFRIYDGPNSNDFVELGPLVTNQIVLLRSHPGKRTVHDLSSVPSTPQEQSAFQQILNQFLSFAFANNVSPLIQAIVSFFGVLTPQGNTYSLLKGRFSDGCAIPPMSPNGALQAYYVRVEISGGNGSSKVIATGTPLRRYPL